MKLRNEIPVSGHWDDTLLNRHTAAVSLNIDPANT